MNYEFEVFISYRSEDPPFTWLTDYFIKNFEYLLKSKIPQAKIFFDKSGLKGTDKWEPTLWEALAKSRILMPIITPSFFDDGSYTLKEIAYMYRRHSISSESNALPIIPIVLCCDFEDLVFECQMYDFSNTNILGLTYSQKAKNVLIQKSEQLVSDIKKRRNNLPVYSDDFLDTNLFEFSKRDLESIREKYKLSVFEMPKINGI